MRNAAEAPRGERLAPARFLRDEFEYAQQARLLREEFAAHF